MSKMVGTGEPLGEGDLIVKVAETLRNHEMVCKGDTIIVGVSGGVDSVCLLDILARLAGPFDLHLVVAHIHHGLREEEADEDFRFVQRLASRYEVGFEGMKLGPEHYGKGENVQARARSARYTFFDEVALKWNAQKIATGHHRGDQVETLLLELFRGTGTLRGIHPVLKGRVIRPLIDVDRPEILTYTAGRGLAYRSDSSNVKRSYLRNRIRQELLPWLRKEVNHDVSRSLLRFSSILAEESRYLDQRAWESLSHAACEGAGPATIVLDCRRLSCNESAIRRRMIREAYRMVAGTTKRLSFEHVGAVLVLVEGRGEKAHGKVSLPGAVQVCREYDRLVLCRSDPWLCPPYEYALLPDTERLVPEAGLTFHASPCSCKGGLDPGGQDPDVAHIACGPIQACRLTVRNVRPGDRFCPLGLSGTKKVKDFFIDEKIPKSWRCRVPLLLVNDRIAWVVGHRLDRRYGMTKQAKTCIKVRVERRNNRFELMSKGKRE